MTTAPAPDSPRTRDSGAAVAALFFVNGATFSNWLPRIPEIRDQLGLGNAGLGATLLGGGLGGIIGALVVAKLMDRLGSRRLLTLVATALSIGMPLIAFAPTAVALLILLTILGVLDVCNDVAMNAQGVIVQHRLGRSIMNRLHAMWSMGFTGGALVGSAASAAGASVRAQLLAVGAVMFVTVAVVRRWLIPVDPPPNAAAPVDDAGPGPRTRSSTVGVVMALAALGAIALEVMPNDWSAVLMRDEFDFGRASGFGTMACAGAMLVGRLGGDHVLDRIGERRLFTLAITLVGIGALVTVLAPVGVVALVGLAVWGLGLSVVFPQLYATAARLPGVSAGSGLGSMLLGQRLGAMVTAVSVGALAEWQDLRVAFAVVAGLAFVVLLVTSRRMMAPNPLAESATRLAGQRPRPRTRSIRRRSRFVGRPAPRSRTANGAWNASDRSGGGGLRSSKHWAATVPPTRPVINLVTSTIRSRWLTRASTWSPTFTAEDGFAASPLILTWPPRQAAAASERVLVIRTACSHWSMRTESMREVWHRPWSVATIWGDSRRRPDPDVDQSPPRGRQ